MGIDGKEGISMDKNKEKDDAEVNHWSLHYMLKELFRGFVKAAYRIGNIRKWQKTYPDSLRSHELRAFYNAVTRLADDTAADNHGTRDGNVELYEQMRDMICTLAHSQQFYIDRFAEVSRHFVEELNKQEGDDYLEWKNPKKYAKDVQEEQ